MTITFPDPPGISPYPPKSTPLLTRDEAVALMRTRGMTTAAEDLAAGKAGPAYVRYKGEHRFDWDVAFAWGQSRPVIVWQDYGEDEDDPPPRVPATHASSAAAVTVAA